jgi:hypothetical protein
LSEAGVGKNMGDGVTCYQLSVISYQLSVIGVKGPGFKGQGRIKNEEL